MAHKRKFKKSSKRRRVGATTHRRRRIGATGLSLKMTSTNPLIKFGSIALGFFMPDLLPIQKLVGDKLDPKLVAGGEAGLGFLLAMKKGKKGVLQTVAGGYLLGAGVKKGLQALGIMSGFGPYNLPVIGQRRLAGPYSNMPVIANSVLNRSMNGYTPNRSMNGYTPNMVMSGYSVPQGRTMNGLNNPQSGYTPSDKGSGYMQS